MTKFTRKDLLQLEGMSAEEITLILDTAESEALWREVRDVGYLTDPGAGQVWRLSLPPAAGAAVRVTSA